MVWEKSTKSHQSHPNLSAWGRKGLGVIRKVTSAVFFQCWGVDFMVISELGNKFLFQPKPRVTQAAHFWLCGWEAIGTTEPSSYLEFLRAAEG